MGEEGKMEGAGTKKGRRKKEGKGGWRREGGKREKGEEEGEERKNTSSLSSLFLPHTHTYQHPS